MLTLSQAAAMAFKPDYGLRLQKDGIGPQVKQFFYSVPLHGFDVTGLGQFTVCLDVPYAGETHALSLDFKKEHLGAILSLLPPSVRQDILLGLEQDPNTPRSVQFRTPVRCDCICATLGQVQHGPYEHYIPLNITDVEVARRSGPEGILEIPAQISSPRPKARQWLRRFSLLRKK